MPDCTGFCADFVKDGPVRLKAELSSLSAQTKLMPFGYNERYQFFQNRLHGFFPEKQDEWNFLQY